MDTLGKLAILHALPTWLPQTQTWIYNQVLELQRLGINAHVVCERIENSGQFYIQNIHCLKAAGWYTSVWDRGIRFLGLRRYLEYAISVGREIDTKIIHSHFGHTGWSNLAAARKLGARHIVTFYGYDVNQLPTKAPIWLSRYKELFSKIDLVLCEGPHMANCILKLGCPEYKIKIQHLGVHVEKIEFKPRFRVGDDPLRILIAASFREKKGIPYAIEALGRIKGEIPLEITIIGDASCEPGNQREKHRILKALIDSGLKEKTRLLGYRPYEVLFQEAYRHHIFLQPSLTAEDGDTEGGAPVVIIEMLASGMPVVSTHHCDIPEVMGPELLQFLSPERNVEALAGCIKYLFKNTQAWNEIATYSRNRIAKEYSLNKQVEALCAYYQNLI